MIAKRIDAGKDAQGRKRHHDYRQLGNYIRDASHEGEKCLMAWHEGCWAPDYDLALVEIEATQAMNTRAKSDKTYHLMVSFRPEDEARLTPEAFQRIENAMAEALGLDEHQRLCGVHKNTNNLHLHIAYNLIHPDRLTVATSLHYDFHKLSKACRALEKEFGLVVDNGIEVSDPLEPKISQRAAAMEAHSGEQSFQSFVLEQREPLLAEIEIATDWQEVHQALASYGIAIRPKANGLVLANVEGKGSIKASAVDKIMSRMRMEERFGSFAEPNEGSNEAEPEKFDVTKGLPLESFIREHKQQILSAVEAAENWQDVRQVLAGHGLMIRQRSGGLVLTDLAEKETIKASAVNRGLSRMHMEARLGQCTEPEISTPKESVATVDEVSQESDEATSQSSVLQQREQILAEMQNVRSWQEVHQALAGYGIAIRPKAKGLILVNINGKETMKASELDRGMSRMYLENRFGAFAEPERQQKQAEQAGTDAAQEAYSGGQPFETFVLAQKEHILKSLNDAMTWQEAHQALASYGIAIRPKANGLVLANITGRETMKASDLDRSMSKKYLEDRLGPFARSETTDSRQAKAEKPGPDESARETYQKKPRQPRSPERDQLYKDYQAVLAEKIARIDEEKARTAASHGWLKEKWQKMKGDLYATTYSHQTRAVRMRMMLTLHRKDVAHEKADHQAAMAEIKADYPWYNWNGYLQHQAAHGNAVALGVLRSMEERKAAIKNPATEKTFLEVQFDDREAAKEAGAKWDRQEKRWYAPVGADLDKLTAWLPGRQDAGQKADQPKGEQKTEESVKTVPVQGESETPKEKKTPGERLEFLAWQEKQRIRAGMAQKSFFSGCSYRIDNRGVVIINLVSGGTIRDAGKKLHFSPDEDSRQAARLYAMAKFGKHFTEKDNCMEMRGSNGKWHLLKPHLGILKECALHGLRTLSQLPMVRGRRKSEVLLQGHAHNDMER
ncbi:MAG: relaxase/mobilization nuclease domain-containing protein [Desulfobulbaceae bacterium]|nr:relaxase/mobilization nuclease domain-containing protein [Desulfobulbaceae bacterium]